MEAVLIFGLFMLAGYVYILFSRFIVFIFINDFNWKSFIDDWKYDADDYGFETSLCMFLWPVIVIKYIINKIFYFFNKKDLFDY